MEPGREILYLSNADIEACALTVLEVEAAVEGAFAAKAAGRTGMRPKLALRPPEGSRFLALAGTIDAAGDIPARAGMKWVGVADNRDRGLPHIAGLVVLSDGETGMPLAVMDARWITGARTAAISVVAARRMAKPGSAGVGFIACGVQARAHLAALRPHFPLKQVRAYSRRLATAEGFAAEARDLGFAAEAVTDPREALTDMDIVICSTPAVPRPVPFLDIGWLAPGAFVSMVDLGVSWEPRSLTRLDRVMTDDIAQAKSEGLADSVTYDGEVADLVAGNRPGRLEDDDRTALLFAGPGLADVAMAQALCQRAAEKGIGRILPV